jgi:hypothetical protein
VKQEGAAVLAYAEMVPKRRELPLGVNEHYQKKDLANGEYRKELE